MPRTARILIANTPHHIVQRGHNRQPVFYDADDYIYYLENLVFFKQEFKCKIYAYCLMTNHVHLVINPGRKPESISLLMKHVAGRQTRYINKREQRTGSLWEGRFKSSIISKKEYLPACCRYIELNPLRAGMVADPAEYNWSSCPCTVKGRKNPVVDLPPFYRAFGSSAGERQQNYSAYLTKTIPDNELKLIRDALQRGQVTGGNRYRKRVAKKLGVRLSNRGPGRPKKSGK